MSERSFKVGDVLENSVRQFTKVVSIRNNRYGLSGWTDRGNAEKATVAMIFLNINGMTGAQVKVVKKGSSKSDDSASTANEVKTNAKPTKSALNKLNAQAVKDLAVKLGIEVVDADTRATVLEKLYTHYEL